MIHRVIKTSLRLPAITSTRIEQRFVPRASILSALKSTAASRVASRSAQVARDYDLNLSSLHRHKTNCLKLASSNQIMKDAARGSAAVALLPSKEMLSSAYAELRARIDQIVEQAQAAGIAQRCDLWAEFNPSNTRQSCATGGAPPTRQYAGECRRTDQRQCRARRRSPNGSFKSLTMSRNSKRGSRKHYWRSIMNTRS